MIKITITFLALSSKEFECSFQIEENEFKELAEFISLFGSVNNLNNKKQVKGFELLQQNTPQLRRDVDKYIDKHKSAGAIIYKLRTYFHKLQEGEWFFLVIRDKIEQKKYAYYNDYLKCKKEDLNYRVNIKETNILYGKFNKTYTSYTFDSSINWKIRIGEKDKTKRICRFCNNSRNNVSFKKTAHAFSESIGNKSIILNEECDKCNEEFGSGDGIESSLISYFKMDTIFYGVPGKNGIPKFKGKNFKIENKDRTFLVNHYKYKDSDSKKTRNPEKDEIKLETFERVSNQDIYRALCKYFLSVIDGKYLSDFEETIKWIRKETSITKLPNIAIIKPTYAFKPYPSLTIYIRKTNDPNLPYAVGEFTYTVQTMVFIVPLTKRDTIDFTKKEQYIDFGTFFRHYGMPENWKFWDFSNDKKEVMNIYMSRHIKKEL